MNLKPPNPKKVANVLLNDFRGLCNKYKTSVEDCGISSEEFSILVRLHELDLIDKKQLKEILEKRIQELQNE
jgi:Asp-tRNA(Asn)/Glu-tRNA(Gln) amidotransferase B subunit